MSARAEPYFAEGTLDDLMHSVIEAMRERGKPIKPTKGPALELTGVLLELTNPRARLSRTETRGKAFSCLGELCWYLARNSSLEFIKYYILEYERFAEDGHLYGGYGPRLFDWRGLNQVANVVDILREKTDSRQAVIQLFDATDIAEHHEDVPCTCTLQFLKRGAELHMLTCMRSNDVVLGLPHDLFSFSMLQEIVARTLSLELGTYKHAVGSLHLYDDKVPVALRFLDEGWQSTKTPMPPMPVEDPWPAIGLLLEAEVAIRTGVSFDLRRLKDVDDYWADLIRLLQVFRCKRDRDLEQIRSIRGQMRSDVYTPFLDRLLS